MSLTLPDMIGAEELALKLGWSARRLKAFARGLGACRIMGNRVRFTQADVDAILEASRPCPSGSRNAVKSGTTRAPSPEGDYAALRKLRSDPRPRKRPTASKAFGSTVIDFMFLTGARISEALGVTWGDVDLGSQNVVIRMGKLDGEKRTAHLPPPLVTALANMPGSREPSDQVFPYSSYRACADPWEVAIRRAGVERLTPHCCRHGFATSMLHAGIDVITVAEAGGWKSPAQLFKTYGHPRREKSVTNVLVGAPVTQNAGEDGKYMINNAKSRK